MLDVSAAAKYTFETIDYFLFAVTLLIPTVIGIYFGWRSNKTTEEYLFGERMKVWPVAISLVASQVSGIAVMATPAETYSYGIMYIFTIFALVLVVPVLSYVIFPVYFENNVRNCYEYLELRFNKITRQVVTLLFVFSLLCTLPVFMFVPSLGLSQVSGVNVHIINTIVCSICIFYTMMGGIKAVVWSDVLQAGIMSISIILVAAVGTNKIGGVGKVIEIAKSEGHFHISFSLDPRERTTIWNCSFQGFFLWLGYVGCGQVCAQRIVSLANINEARRSLFIYGIGHLIVGSLACITGIIMYAYYHGCDPVSAKLVQKADKLIPFLVEDLIGKWYGMPGVFISSVFSAALSTMSAGMNTLSGIFYCDYVKPFITHTEFKANLIMKCFVIFSGVFSILGGYIVEHFQSIVQLTITIIGTSVGLIASTFFLGLLVPRVSGQTVLISFCSSLLATLFLVIGGQKRMASGKLVYKTLPMRTDGCYTSNGTLFDVLSADSHTAISSPSEDRSFSIYDISFFYYVVVAAALMWCIAIGLSLVFPNKTPVPSKLLAPFMRPSRKYNAVATEANDAISVPEIATDQLLKRNTTVLP